MALTPSNQCRGGSCTIEVCIVIILVLVSVLFGYLVLGCNDCRFSRPVHHSRPVPDTCSTGLHFEPNLVNAPH